MTKFGVKNKDAAADCSPCHRIHAWHGHSGQWSVANCQRISLNELSYLVTGHLPLATISLLSPDAVEVVFSADVDAAGGLAKASRPANASTWPNPTEEKPCVFPCCPSHRLLPCQKGASHA